MHHGVIALKRQHGGTLLVALVFLVVLGLLSLTSMQISRLQLRMSNNEEVRIAALQAAQAMTDAIAATPAMTPVIGGIGFTLCTPGGDADVCDRESLFMPAGELQPEVAAGHLSAQAVITSPPGSPPPRGLGYSADKFGSTAFQVTSQYDRADEGRGRATVNAGLVVLTPTL